MPDSNVETLKEILSKTTPVGARPKAPDPATDEAEPEALTIKQMDGNYSTMRPANKILTRLHVIHKDGTVETLQYHFLDAKSEFKGGEFVFVFAGAKHWQLTVKGHGLKFWAVYDYISLHRWPYLRAAAGSMVGANGDGETVFTEIKVVDVTPKPE